MMKKKCWVAVVMLMSCGKPTPTLEGIDLEKWKNDRNGCQQVRASMLQKVQEQVDAIRGLSENQIVTLLGRPDRNELYKRNQKFYYYAIDPATECGLSDTSRHELVLRFNAMSRAKEVSIEEVME